jgi:hypothetical protein
LGHYLQALEAEDPTTRSSPPWWETPSTSCTACKTRLVPWSTVVREAPVRAATPQTGAVEELLPLVVMGRAAPLAVVMVRPGSAGAVICLS